MLSKYVIFLCGIYWKKIPELSEHLWEKNMEQIAEGWFLDLQEFLEVWPSVKGGGNTKRRWLYMYPVFWFDEPKSVEVWKRKKRRKHGADELQFYIRRR